MKTSVRRFLALSLSLAVLVTMAPRVDADDGAEVRRAFLETAGAWKRLEFNFWVNFSEEFELLAGDAILTTDPDFRNVFLGLLDVPVVGGIRVGDEARFGTVLGIRYSRDTREDLGRALNRLLGGDDDDTSAGGEAREEGAGVHGRTPWGRTPARTRGEAAHSGRARRRRQQRGDAARRSARRPASGRVAAPAAVFPARSRTAGAVASPVARRGTGRCGEGDSHE